MPGRKCFGALETQTVSVSEEPSPPLLWGRNDPTDAYTDLQLRFQQPSSEHLPQNPVSLQESGQTVSLHEHFKDNK